jgi:hypothetical protein
VAALIGASCGSSDEVVSGPVDAASDSIVDGGASDGSGASNPCGADLQNDPRHCGACGHDCLGGACAVGRCQAVVVYVIPSGAGAVDTPVALAVDATSVYFSVDATKAASARGSLWKVPITGGPPALLLGDQEVAALDIALNGAYLYWAPAAAVGRIAKLPRTGGTPEMVSKYAYPTVRDGGTRLAVDATSIYWSTGTNVVKKAIDSVVVDGGTESVVTLGGGVVTGIALDATSVDFADKGSGMAMKVPIGGGTSVPIGSPGALEGQIAVDATAVYRAMQGPLFPHIQKDPLGVGAAVKLRAGDSIVDFAVDPSGAYWLERDGRVVMQSTDGATPAVVLATGSNASPPGRIALSANAVYWTTTAGTDLGRILRVAK